MRPYVTIHERIAFVPDPAEDGGPGTVIETCQVDLWQNATVLGTGSVNEDYSLLPKLEHGLHGQRTQAIGTPNRTVYRVWVMNSIDVPDPDDENLVHAALTVELRREF